ncbi:MAG: TonB-dependent receptor [Gammaproteobacteria bacterium]|nr:TonB-dependent receptor [Gammaproteobacteria bacterium]
MRGRVVDQSGDPVAGASIVVTDTRTGGITNFRTNESGAFLAVRLPVGGPYQVSVEGGEPVVVNSLALGETYNLTIQVERTIEEIITTGRVPETVDTALGPAATFDFGDLNQAVAFNRDIRDVYAADPRLNIDGFQTNCAGKHPRFNSTTLDGVSHNDRFGLNNNGYSTATGMPFPFDAIQQVSVEMAPYDVTYGGFSACNINAVTRSGTNEFRANVFYEYTTQDLINTKLDGQDFSSPENYRREKLGASVGGPILKDRLFFFAAYEETEAPQFQSAGFAGSGNGVERDWLSEEDFNTINDAAQNIYQYDTGGMPGNNPQESENYMVRLDWNITDRHDLALIHNYYDGFRTNCSDSDPNEFEFANHCYVKGAESETTTAILSSQWTDAFSTELFWSDSTMNDSQVTVGDKDIGDHQINIDGFSNTVYLGADDSRQANKLFTDSQYLKLSAQFLAGNHLFSVGFENEETQVFNIFVQHSRGGEWDYYDDAENNPAACDALSAQGRYDDWVLQQTDPANPGIVGCGTSGIDKFVLGRPSRTYYGSGGGTNNAIDAAADFTNNFNAIFLQDEMYFPNSDFTLTAGVRFEWISSDDAPNYNSAMSEAIGIRNDSGLDGVNVLMPRVGFNWGINEDLTLRGGAGLFSGGNPFVWLSNAWSRDGVTNVQPNIRYSNRNDCLTPETCRPSVFDGTIPVRDGVPGGQIPVELYDTVGAAGPDDGFTSRNNLIDPNYEQPQEWKYSLGATWDMPWWGVRADIDYNYTVLEKGALYVDVSQDIVGTTALGNPIFANIGSTDGNLMLTNAKRDSTAHVISLVLNKEFDWGLDLLLGYAWTDAQDASPMTSFTAGSSFTNLATNDINNPEAARSNYMVRNRLTLRGQFSREFWGDNLTRFTLVGYYNEGQPNSFTVRSDDVLSDDFTRQHLLYVPDGPNDSLAYFSDPAEATAFFAWADNQGLKRGAFVGRNTQGTKSSSRIDLRVDQEIPLGLEGLKGRLFVKIYNFTNMLNDDWGRQYDSRFFSRDVVEVESLDATGAYVYSNFTPGDLSDLQETRSLWEMRLGLEVNFR